MLDYMLPKFKYDYIKYASIFTFELRQDNECMKSVVFNPQGNCMNIRIKYNGQFVDLSGKTVYEDSAINDGPDTTMSSSDIASLEDSYDLPYVKFKSIMDKLMIPGDQIKDECAKPYVPNPDPATLQYFVENMFLQKWINQF